MFSIAPAILRRIWRFVGWFGIALLLYLSITPQPPEVPIAGGDKLGHALAYAVLMYWWSQLLDSPRQRYGLAAGLIALGIAIEIMQGWTSWRTFDYADMLADGAGIACGFAMSVAVPNVLKLFGRKASRSR